MPDEKAFDSNCITPGTPFMARLSKHLQYFVNKKMSEDADWRGVKVILSGHEVPGEGEHKIQEFIRLHKAQPDYNPNTRHCLYGLDADLIMLGLLSHDPHFCLLREEVTFGRKTKKNTGLVNQNFFLLHLSLLREYLDLEFSSISEELPFEYDLERIIDDFILLSVFVGNDFLPHLPNLHIGEGAMEEIWGIYKRVLPHTDGYINNSGTIETARLQLVLDELAKAELEIFEKEYADLNWYKGKQQKEIAAMEAARSRGQLVMTKKQKTLFAKIKAFVKNAIADPSSSEKLEFVNDFPARDRRFLQELGDALHLEVAWDEADEYGQNLVVLRPTPLDAAAATNGNTEEKVETAEEDATSDENEEESSEPDHESKAAIERVLNKYQQAKVVDDTVEDFEESYEAKLQGKLEEWKHDYYKTKLGFKDPQKDEVATLAFRYIEGLQWVMNYYYKGVASWGWYYDYHYAPRISDLTSVASMKFDFDIGVPFRPFQQLMGVLPAASQEHIPLAYRDLMYDPNSPILDFYPEKFEEDLNGKKQDWEAIVKIPFIDEKRLLKAMAAREHRLTPEEKSRNQMGQLSDQFTYDPDAVTTYPSSWPGVFPDLARCKCRVDLFVLPNLGDGVELIQGLLDGVHLGVSALAGFPSMNTLPHHAQLLYHSVNVHGQDSKNPSMVISVENAYEGVKGADIAAKMVGQRTFLYWPFLQEGIVVAVSDDLFRYEKRGNAITQTPQESMQLGNWKKKCDWIESHYSKRFGVITGNIDVLLHIRPLRGLKRMDTGALVKDYEGPEKETEQAVQLAVSQVTFEDERYLEQDPPSLAEEFPVGSKVVFLSEKAYGIAAQVIETKDDSLGIQLAFFPSEAQENELFPRVVRSRPTEQYTPAHILSRSLGISPFALSRITSSLLVQIEDSSKHNIGLSLKFESKGLKVLGYTRKADRGWEFSRKAYELIKEYTDKFPDVFGNLNYNERGIAQAKEFFPKDPKPDARVKEIRTWFKEKGVLALEPVTLFAEQLEQSTVQQIEELANQINASRDRAHIKKVKVLGLPRQIVLKPSHAIYRLQGQLFTLGDRVMMVQDSAVGGVTLSMKGVVIGVNADSIDVVWDVPFMGGSTLGGRCSEHRGSVVPFASCLNLTRKQFAVSAGTSARPIGTAPAFKPRLGPAPVVPGQHFKPGHHAPARRPPVAIMSNPTRNADPAHMHYGNAMKGVNAHAGGHIHHPAQQVPHAHVLRNALTGHSGGLGARPPAARPAAAAVRPTPSNGQAAVDPPVGPMSPTLANGSHHPIVHAVRGRGASHRGQHRGATRGRGRPVAAAEVH